MQDLLYDIHIHIANPWLAGFIGASLILLIYCLLFVVGRKYVLLALQKMMRAFNSESHENLAFAFFKILRRLGALVGLDLIIEGLPVPPRLTLWVSNGIFVVVTIMIGAGLFDFVDVLGGVLRVRAREFETLVTKLLKILIATVALMVLMRHFNYDIWHIMTALGVGTLAVGLAAQPTLANMIAGFTILIDRPFRRGDHISLASGDTGDVQHIGMRSTHIKTPDGNMLIVSNTELVNSRVTNYSMPNESFAQKVKFYFDQGSDFTLIKPMIKKCVETTPGVVKGTTSVLAVNLNDWSVEIDAFYQVESYTQTGNITDKIIDAVMAEMKNKQIQFATNPQGGTKKI